jgi:hypothetical protein
MFTRLIPLFDLPDTIHPHSPAGSSTEANDEKDPRPTTPTVGLGTFGIVPRAGGVFVSDHRPGLDDHKPGSYGVWPYHVDIRGFQHLFNGSVCSFRQLEVDRVSGTYRGRAS